MCRPRLARLPLAPPSRPSSRRACRASALCPLTRLDVRPVSSHPLALPALVSPARLALLTLPVSRVGGRGVPRLALISSCVPPTASACLLAALRSARLRLGMLYAILCVVAMGTVGCGAFVPRFHKLTSFLWASCLSLLQHGVPFFYFLSSPFLV